MKISTPKTEILTQISMKMTRFFLLLICLSGLFLTSFGQGGQWGAWSSYERNDDFDDLPLFQFQISSGLNMPYGVFASKNSPESGHAENGFSHGFAINYYVLHFEANEGRGVHCLGSKLDFTRSGNKFNRETFEGALSKEYQNPLALTTEFQNRFAHWQQNSFQFGMSYLYVTEQRFMVGLDIGYASIFGRTPEYITDKGNFIPQGYAHFFRPQRISGGSARAVTGTLSLRYLLARNLGISANVETVMGRYNVESEVYDTFPTGNGLFVSRRVEEIRIPLRTANYRFGVFVSFGDTWEKRNKRKAKSS